MAKSSRLDGSKRVQRNSRGQFVKGSASPSPGRPPLATEASAMKGISWAASAEKAAELMDKLHAKAMKGDVRAADTWLKHAYRVDRDEQSFISVKQALSLANQVMVAVMENVRDGKVLAAIQTSLNRIMSDTFDKEFANDELE